MSSFEPFRSVVIPKGKMGAPFDPNAPPDPAAARETRTIILEGPALDPEAISPAPAPSGRRTTVSRPSSPAERAPAAKSEASPASSEVFVLDATLAEPEQSVAAAPPPPRGKRTSASHAATSPATGTQTAQRQYVVAYDGHLVGTYRCAKRIQNRTAYLKVAEQLVGQIEAFDPERIRLYRLTEVPIEEPIRREELGMSFHSFPRDDVPAPGT